MSSYRHVSVRDPDDARGGCTHDDVLGRERANFLLARLERRPPEIARCDARRNERAKPQRIGRDPHAHEYQLCT
jgi:hypothetical protein